MLHSCVLCSKRLTQGCNLFFVHCCDLALCIRWQGLIQGADSSGRLTLPAPAPGHVLLLTVPDSVSRSELRGVGLFREPSTHSIYYFQTVAFHVPAPQQFTREPIDRLHHIPPRSTDATLFGSRRLSIALDDGRVFQPRNKFALSHISTLPATGPRNERELTIYPRDLLNTILHGPSAHSAASVRWSSRPNWMLQGNKQGKIISLDSQTDAQSSVRATKLGSPKKWIASLRKSLTRSSVNEHSDAAPSSSS